ncbi:MAG TPA: response regulator transcription factor [Candidatus Protoclostridium stercorigallinarum]|uniref:Stage 0 sporulation protein A homolog n=1 Tax=Candidatus Protoclostridium stercorigallinarum TaxID=2838741 RepID=A0A9D1PYP0_9FIRM|nr:response regulator transcription factor [Candidatus Protoclostridium stercorigallinarum]
MILIVEDEAKIARFVQLELEHEGYAVKHISDGREALESALAHDYELIVLDLMLPSMSGIELLRRLRQSKDTPVIILTARDQTMDKVAGLDIGADDYMTKPFAIEELLARIRVHLKKRENARSDVMTYDKLVIDRNSRSVTFDDVPVDLTKKEYDLLVYLMENKNVVITREQALDAVWGFDFYGNTNVVDVYVRYLRSKIDDVFDIKLVRTVRGAGYIIKDPA